MEINTLLICLCCLFLKLALSNVEQHVKGKDSSRQLALNNSTECLYETQKSSKSPFVVVVPAFWIKPRMPWLDGFNTCIYQRHSENAPSYVINKANEAGVYLRYIVDHYENLPQVVAFVQDDTDEDFGQRIGSLREDLDWGWAPLDPKSFVSNRNLDIWRSQKNVDMVHACWVELGSIFGVNIPTTSDPIVSFYCCANFALTSTQIRKHPRSAYLEAYYKLVLRSSCSSNSTWNNRPLIPQPEDSKHANGGAFEHLNHALLGGQKLNMEPFGMKEWCLRYKSNYLGSPCIAGDEIKVTANDSESQSTLQIIHDIQSDCEKKTVYIEAHPYGFGSTLNVFMMQAVSIWIRGMRVEFTPTENSDRQKSLYDRQFCSSISQNTLHCIFRSLAKRCVNDVHPYQMFSDLHYFPTSFDRRDYLRAYEGQTLFREKLLTPVFWTKVFKYLFSPRTEFEELILSVEYAIF